MIEPAPRGRGRRRSVEVGETHHGIEIVAFAGVTSSGAYFTCRCSCGVLFRHRGSDVAHGRKTHCGCKSKYADLRDLPHDRSTKTSVSALRAEGVLEVGGLRGTAIVYVRTAIGLHLFHMRDIEDRLLDDYGISLAVNWLEMGLPAGQVAGNLGIGEGHLATELARAGYERVSLQDGRSRVGGEQRLLERKRASRIEREQRGNRRGSQLVRAGAKA